MTKDKDNQLTVQAKKLVDLTKYVDKSWIASLGNMGRELNVTSYAEGKDEACLYVDLKTGATTLVSWDISGHNGDPYGREEVLLSPVEALHRMQHAEEVLMKEAREKARAEVLEDVIDAGVNAKLAKVLGKR